MSAKARHRRARIDDVPLHWVEMGDDRGATPVVLLHGLYDSHRTWKHVDQALAHDRRVLLPDLPGHGLSQRARPNRKSGLSYLPCSSTSALHGLFATLYPSSACFGSRGCTILPRMSECSFCCAPITLSGDAPTTCKFCGRANDPSPREVAVPVQVVHNVIQVVGTPSGAPAELRCPHCRKRLVGVIAKDVELNGCTGCGGIWVDNASARKVLANPEEIFAELATRAGENAKNRNLRVQNPACPACTAVLDRVATRGIQLDACSEHGTWFDAFELRSLVHVLKGTPADTKVHPGDKWQVACSSCRAPLPANRANIGPDGLLCERCWRAAEANEIAATDAAVRERGGIAMGGALLGIAAVMLGAAVSGSSRS